MCESSLFFLVYLLTTKLPLSAIEYLSLVLFTLMLVFGNSISTLSNRYSTKGALNKVAKYPFFGLNKV